MTDIVQLKIRALRDKKRELLNMPPGEALDTILNSKHPAAIVHALTEQDFHLLIHDIGLDDSRPLLALAAERQLEYIVDMETWTGDLINNAAATRWLDRLYRADPDRTTRWLMRDKLDLLEIFLYKNIHLLIREHDQESSTLPESYFTHDDVLYIRILDGPNRNAPETGDTKLKEQLIRDLLTRMAAEDYPLYRGILLEAMQLIPAETIEREYRLRNVRMAEKGFLPYEEAVGIYQPITSRQLFSQTTKSVPPDTGADRLPVPVLSATYVDAGSFFARALKAITNSELNAELQAEFATLCNQVIVADKSPIREKRELEAKVNKACGYMSLGLEHLAGGTRAADIPQAAVLISKYRLSELFRVGYGLCLELKWQAQKWQQSSWAQRSKLSLKFWGEAWLGVLGGLLLDHPRFYDNYADGVLYREFESLADIEQTRSVLAAVAIYDNLLARMEIVLEPLGAFGYVGHTNLLLTLWARQVLDISGEVTPLTIETIRKFFTWLWGESKRPYAISDEKKEQFLGWFSGAAALPDVDLSRTLGQTLEDLFKNLEEEFANVAPRDLALKYVQGFFLTAPEA